MAVTLQPDPTLAGFNSYCSRAEANEYLLERRLHGSTWDSCPNKDAALLWATRELDRLNWTGYRATSSNRHEWPRSGVTDVGSTEIPDQVKDACAELAFYLAAADRASPSTQEEFDEITVGPIKLKYRESSTGRELTSEMPDTVRALVRRFLAAGASSSGANRKAVRV